MLAIAVLLAVQIAVSPLSYDLVSKPTGKEDVLVMALHGALSTAKFYCGTFMKGRLEKLAAERNYIVVCPSGVGMNPRYEDYEDRLLALHDELRRMYPSVRQVFLMGHSLGGRGALLIGIRHPEKFGAIAVAAPALKLRKDNKGSLDAITSLLATYNRPLFLAWGLKDFLSALTPIDIGALTLAGHGFLEPHPYNSTHLTIGADSVDDMFDFFDRQRGNATLFRDVR